MVIGLAVVAIFVGAMMPGGPHASANETAIAGAEQWFDDEGSTSTVPSRASSSAASGGRSDSTENVGSEVRLTRSDNGHFYAKVDINGTPTEFMIDTGATGIAMTERDAVRAGVRLDPDERTYVGEGAGGALTGQRITLARVKLGPRSSSEMDAVVIDGAATNLLGQSFLSQFREVTVRGDVMTLR